MSTNPTTADILAATTILDALTAAGCVVEGRLYVTARTDTPAARAALTCLIRALTDRTLLSACRDGISHLRWVGQLGDLPVSVAASAALADDLIAGIEAP